MGLSDAAVVSRWVSRPSAALLAGVSHTLRSFVIEATTAPPSAARVCCGMTRAIVWAGCRSRSHTPLTMATTAARTASPGFKPCQRWRAQERAGARASRQAGE